MNRFGFPGTWRAPGVVVLMVAGLLGASVATAVYAHGGGSGLIHSCVKFEGDDHDDEGEGKVVRGHIRILQDPDAACKKKETPLDWNVQGPAGAGGGGGLTGYEVKDANNVGAPETTARATCSINKHVIGGGASTWDPDRTVHIVLSQPDGQNTQWAAAGADAIGTPRAVRVWAICANVAP